MPRALPLCTYQHWHLFQNTAEPEPNPNRQRCPDDNRIAEGQRLRQNHFNACHEHNPRQEKACTSQDRSGHCIQQRREFGNQPCQGNENSTGHHNRPAGHPGTSNDPHTVTVRNIGGKIEYPRQNTGECIAEDSAPQLPLGGQPVLADHSGGRGVPNKLHRSHQINHHHNQDRLEVERHPIGKRPGKRNPCRFLHLVKGNHPHDQRQYISSGQPEK